jgi:hypothetical protein
MDNPANYFKTYRLELGFSNQSDAKFFLAAKDITPDIDYAYITLLNERLIKILKNLNKILVGDFIHSKAMAGFYKFDTLVKNCVLLIIHIFAKVSMNTYSFDAIILRNSFSLSYFVFFNIIDTLILLVLMRFLKIMT